MNEETFRALYVQENNGETEREIQQVPVSFLPDHEVRIRVWYSSLNYKDALSSSGNKGVTRQYPHIPGIDAAGVVLSDASGRFKQGQKVIVTGKDLGSNTPGGFGECIHVPADWVVEMPQALDPESSMVFGTAGFTAMYGLLRLQREGITPGESEVLVTGATGGVGSLAVYFLGKQGYHVIAATGKTKKEDWLKNLGAAEVIHRDEVTGVKDKLLLSRRWDGAIETVGGEMLDAVIRQAGHDGAVACCGNILGHELNTNIYPFILRGVSLLGIDSAICKTPMRLKIWEQMAEAGIEDLPENFSQVVQLEGLEKEIQTILKGGQTGRVVVKHREP